MKTLTELFLEMDNLYRELRGTLERYFPKSFPKTIWEGSNPDQKFICQHVSERDKVVEHPSGIVQYPVLPEEAFSAMQEMIDEKLLSISSPQAIDTALTLESPIAINEGINEGISDAANDALNGAANELRNAIDEFIDERQNQLANFIKGVRDNDDMDIYFTSIPLLKMSFSEEQINNLGFLIVSTIDPKECAKIILR